MSRARLKGSRRTPGKIEQLRVLALRPIRAWCDVEKWTERAGRTVREVFVRDSRICVIESIVGDFYGYSNRYMDVASCTRRSQTHYCARSNERGPHSVGTETTSKSGRINKIGTHDKNRSLALVKTGVRVKPADSRIPPSPLH